MKRGIEVGHFFITGHEGFIKCALKLYYLPSSVKALKQACLKNLLGRSVVSN